MIIGLTGTHGSGKGTVAKYLVNVKGFFYLRFSDVFRNECNKRNLNQTRKNLITVSGELVRMYGKDYAAKKLIEKINSNLNYVVDGFRRVNEVDLFRKKFSDFILIAIDADQKLRYDRIVKRKDTTDSISYDEFRKLENIEMRNIGDNMNIISCMNKADHLIMNNDSEEDLIKKIETIL